jgi:membrane-bound ClpP family serine protease
MVKIMVKIKQKTKNRIFAVLLLIGLIILIIDSFQNTFNDLKYGHCGFYRWVIGSIKLGYVNCEGNNMHTYLQNYMGYFMMIFNPITILAIFFVDMFRGGDNA